MKDVYCLQFSQEEHTPARREHTGKHPVCKERLRNDHSLEETKVTSPLSAMWDSGWDLGTEKEHPTKKTTEICIKCGLWLRVMN